MTNILHTSRIEMSMWCYCKVMKMKIVNSLSQSDQQLYMHNFVKKRNTMNINEVMAKFKFRFPRD